MSTVKSKKLQIGTDASASNNFTIYQPATPDGTLRIGVGNADSPTEVGRFTSAGYVATNAPAFSAYLGSAQSVSVATFTKVSLNVENFDTNSNYDNSTNYRFTPTVAGYYQINACVLVQQTSGTGTIALCQVRKNGTTVIQQEITCTFNSGLSCCASGLVYLNGSTDYVELYGYTNASSGQSIGAGLATTYMNGILVQQA